MEETRVARPHGDCCRGTVALRAASVASCDVSLTGSRGDSRVLLPGSVFRNTGPRARADAGTSVPVAERMVRLHGGRMLG